MLWISSTKKLKKAYQLHPHATITLDNAVTHLGPPQPRHLNLAEKRSPDLPERQLQSLSAGSMVWGIEREPCKPL